MLVARLDNLGKGAAGAAVQNIRLMLGLGDAAAQPAAAKARLARVIVCRCSVAAAMTTAAPA